MAPVSHAERCRFLAQSPFFRAFSPRELERLAASLVERRFADRQTIFSRGDFGSSLLVVAAGRVRIGITSAEGREVQLAIVEPGHVFGELALFASRERSAAATALGPCLVYVLEQRELLALLRQSPELAIRLLEVLCARVRAATERLEGTMLTRLPVRLARLLHGLAAQQAQSLQARSPQAGSRIELSQAELARRIGASRQKVNLHLGRWCAEGLLERQGPTLVIRDPVRLAAIAGEE
jgi:CRP-like cAMP-binding protein